MPNYGAKRGSLVFLPPRRSYGHVHGADRSAVEGTGDGDLVLQNTHFICCMNCLWWCVHTSVLSAVLSDEQLSPPPHGARYVDEECGTRVNCRISFTRL